MDGTYILAILTAVLVWQYSLPQWPGELVTVEELAVRS